MRKTGTAWRRTAPTTASEGWRQEKSHDCEKQTAELSKAEKRKAEVDRLVAKVYKDKVAERITEYNFNMLSQKYQAEQMELEERIQKLKFELSANKQTASDAEK